MEVTLIFICGILPAFLLMAFVCKKDQAKPEPGLMIVKAFLYGIVSIFVSTLFSLGLDLIHPSSVDEIPFVHGMYIAFFDAALPEETAKLLMLWLLLRKCKYFDEYMDGIVYAVCIGMGFAATENIVYLFNSYDTWVLTAFLRAVLAVPGHYIDAVVMGMLYALVHFNPAKFGKYKYWIWLAPFLLHGIYDALCFASEELPAVAGIFTLALYYFCFRMHRFCLGRIKAIALMDKDRTDAQTFIDGISQEINQ